MFNFVLIIFICYYSRKKNNSTIEIFEIEYFRLETRNLLNTKRYMKKFESIRLEIKYERIMMTPVKMERIQYKQFTKN